MTLATAPRELQITGSAGHAHAYWALCTPVPPVALEQANRTLADNLGADLASVDAARILRPAGALSHKYQPPVPVELLHLDRATRYELAALVDGLEPARSEPTAATASRESPARTEIDELLLAIPAATYVRELAGLEPRRNGKVSCRSIQTKRPASSSTRTAPSTATDVPLAVRSTTSLRACGALTRRAARFSSSARGSRTRSGYGSPPARDQ